MAFFARRPGREPPNVAAIVGDNLVPIAGVLLLGWNASSLVVIYFAGFRASSGSCWGTRCS